MSTATIYRPCAYCGRQFGQPDDPGRKRRYCTDACKQAAYRARRRNAHSQREDADQEDARRQREDAHRYRRYQEYQRQERARAHQPPPWSGSNGHRADTAEQARARRRMEALLRKAAATPFPAEAAACRAKAEELRCRYNL